MIDQAIKFAHKRKDKTILELSFKCMNLNRLVEKSKKRYRAYEEDKIRFISGADQRHIISIWGHLRKSLVDFFYDVYCRSSNSSEVKS